MTHCVRSLEPERTIRYPAPVVRDQVASLFGLDVAAPHLDQALTHPSYANEQRAAADNQRLEFLGDSVLGFCASELLYQRFADADEGSLTRLRAQLVSAEALAEFARRHGIGEALRLGRGATGSLRDSTNVLADAVEALIAATYLDAGLERARQICAKIVASRLDKLDVADERDPKSKLQELVQAAGREPPSYAVVDTSGPAHQRWFTIEVTVGGVAVARAGGSSKRQAERAAAARALKERQWQEQLGVGAEAMPRQHLDVQPGADSDAARPEVLPVESALPSEDGHD